MVPAESTEAAVMLGGALSTVPVKVWSSAGIDEAPVTVPDDSV